MWIAPRVAQKTRRSQACILATVMTRHPALAGAHLAPEVDDVPCRLHQVWVDRVVWVTPRQVQVLNQVQGSLIGQFNLRKKDPARTGWDMWEGGCLCSTVFRWSDTQVPLTLEGWSP